MSQKKNCKVHPKDFSFYNIWETVKHTMRLQAAEIVINSFNVTKRTDK